VILSFSGHVQNPTTALRGGWMTGSARTEFGSRKYRLWVPVRHERQRSSALVMMLHGCTQSAEDFAAVSGMNRIADRDDFLVVYPEQSIRANLLKCWNWYDPRHQLRGAGEPAILAKVVAQVQSSHNVDSNRVFVLGISAGGAMGVVLGVTYPDVFIAIGVTAGAEFKGASSRSSALALVMRGGPDPREQGVIAFRATAAGLRKRRRTRIPLIVFQGTMDRRVNPVNADQLIAQWATMNECLAEGKAAPGLQSAGQNARAMSGLVEKITEDKVPGGHPFTRHRYKDHAGLLMEKWIIHGMGHAWSGAPSHFRYGDPKGPNASEEMWRFFCDTSLVSDEKSGID
jgi:poly(hydroxyalkanoate) depolymerase family esterase